MKALFRDIRQGDLEAVRTRLGARPELVHATSSGAPKKDDGQSPLQVAVKTGHTEIAHLLLDHGADVDFMEESEVNRWRMPVLHDAIRAAVMTSRYLARVGWDQDAPVWEPANPPERGDATFALLARILDAGADVHRPDSFGNSALARFALDARQVLPRFFHTHPTEVDPKPLNDELAADLTRISRLLLAHGADPDAVDPDLGQSLLAYYADEPVAPFLRRPPG